MLRESIVLRAAINRCDLSALINPDLITPSS